MRVRLQTRLCIVSHKYYCYHRRPIVDIADNLDASDHTYQGYIQSSPCEQTRNMVRIFYTEYGYRST